MLDGLLWWALLCNIKTLKSALFNLFWRRLIKHQVLNTPNFVVEVLLKRVPQSKLTTKNDWYELHEQVFLSPPIDSNRCLIFNWIFIFDLFLSVHASAEVKRQIKIEVDHFKFNVRLYGFRNIKNIIQHEHTPPSARSTFYLFCTSGKLQSPMLMVGTVSLSFQLATNILTPELCECVWCGWMPTFGH